MFLAGFLGENKWKTILKKSKLMLPPHDHHKDRSAAIYYMFVLLALLADFTVHIFVPPKHCSTVLVPFYICKQRDERSDCSKIDFTT